MTDYIKREDATNAVKMLYGGFGAIANINAIPSADVVERKRGNWMFEGSINKTFNVVTCSRCGVSCIDGGNFCPHCGADMRGREDG